MSVARRSLLVLFVAIVSLASMAAKGQASSPDSPASSPSAAADLFIFNDSGWTLIPGSQAVTDNGKPLASLARQTYARFSIAPGPHQLRPDPFLWKQEVNLDVAPGAKYYVVIAYKPVRSWALPMAGAPLILREITEAEALPLLREMKLQ